MQNNTGIVFAIIMLVVGIGLGYGINGNRPLGTHMMPDGQIMPNGVMDMDDMMLDMNAALRGKSGDIFDKAFIDEMIVHHQGAIDMAQLALVNAKHQEVRDLARAIISAQNGEIAQMKSWRMNWYNQ